MSTRAPLSISKTASAGRYGMFASPNEVINHHAPQTPRRTQSTGLFKRASEGTVMFFKRVFIETSKLVLFVRKQTKRSAKIGVFQESGSKKYQQLKFRKSSIQWRKTRRRNQKIGIVSYSSRKEEETLINKKRSRSNHKWEGRASGKKGAWRSFILAQLQRN